MAAGNEPQGPIRDVAVLMKLMSPATKKKARERLRKILAARATEQKPPESK
ncbi:MAG: hypothetical protein FD152_4507 [Xanthobacteraceae bacterium]|nr:MAG: hypothetical protein FD152_4507 [Xanthobacteraceae bacterium]